MMAEPSTEMPTTPPPLSPQEEVSDHSKCVSCGRKFKLGDYVCLPLKPPVLTFCKTCFSKDNVPGRILLYTVSAKPSSMDRERLLKNKKRLERMAKKQAKGKKR